MDPRPARLLDPLSPSQRKNQELLQQAHGGRFSLGKTRVHHSRCDACANWELCKPEIGEGSAGCNYCARMSRGFKRKE